MIKYPPEIWKHPILGLVPYIYPTPPPGANAFGSTVIMTKQTVGLVMIAKNEAKVLPRCLKSVKHLVSTYTILLNGTTDDSEKIVRESLSGIEGEVIEVPWEGYSKTRNKALERAESKTDYLLLIDADDELECTVLPNLTHDAYDCAVRYKETTYPRTFLIKSEKKFRFEGRIHETLNIPREYDRPCLVNVLYHYHADGQSWEDPDKYKKYAAILLEELRETSWKGREAEFASKVFMLAQSYKDGGMKHEALEAYRNRVQMGGWEQEVFMSWMALGELDRQPECWLRAIQAFPLRKVEALFELTRFFNETGAPHVAWMFAQQAIKDDKPIPIPVALLVHRGVYLWRMQWEYAQAANAVGATQQVKSSLQYLLEYAPEDLRPTVKEALDLLTI